MCIFVNPNETFEIIINFEQTSYENYVKTKICENGTYTLVCEASKRDFKTMSTIIEEATIINSVNGKPFLRNKILCFNIMKHFIKSIKVLHIDQEEYFSIDENSINNMEYDIVKAICKKWLEITSGK